MDSSEVGIGALRRGPASVNPRSAGVIAASSAGRLARPVERAGLTSRSSREAVRPENDHERDGRGSGILGLHCPRGGQCGVWRVAPYGEVRLNMARGLSLRDEKDGALITARGMVPGGSVEFGGWWQRCCRSPRSPRPLVWLVGSVGHRRALEPLTTVLQ